MTPEEFEFVKKNYRYGGKRKATIIWMLNFCLIETELNIRRTDEYFQNTLKWEGFRVSPYLNSDPRMVCVFKDGEVEHLCFFVEELPTLTKIWCKGEPLASILDVDFDIFGEEVEHESDSSA